MTARDLSHRLRRGFERRWARFEGRDIVHVLHIGKTGGTAVKAALAQHRRAPRHQVFLHRHGMRLSAVPAGELAVLFLRDPITRFVSGFNSRRRKGQPRTYIEWSPREATAFARFDTPDALASALDAPDERLRGEAHAAMASIQHVRDHYSLWLGSAEYLRSRRRALFFIGRQERLATDFEALRIRLNLAPSVALPTDPVAAHVAPASMSTHLSEKARENLRRWYDEDAKIVAAADEIAVELCEQAA